MRSNYFRFISVGTIVLMVMMACNMPFMPVELQATSTVTQPASTPTHEALPTETATPATTATITLTPEPSLTPTAEIPVAEVQREVNCRTGPGGMYDLVLTFKAGDTVEIVARDLGGGFVFVKNPNKPEEGCWMLENSLKVSGNLTPLPAFTPPPTPTLAPSFTVTYKKLDKCGDVFVRFIVTNTGGFGFRSAYVKVTNLKNSEVTEKVTNTFDLTIDCVVAQSIGNVTPGGGTAYLESDSFKKDPTGQKMRAVFQLCTEQNLKGACSTAVLEFVAK